MANLGLAVGVPIAVLAVILLSILLLLLFLRWKRNRKGDWQPKTAVDSEKGKEHDRKKSVILLKQPSHDGGEVYVVRHYYKAEAPDHLTLHTGRLIEVLDTSNPDWWKGTIDNRCGWFPAQFVHQLPAGAQVDLRDPETMATTNGGHADTLKTSTERETEYDNAAFEAEKTTPHRKKDDSELIDSTEENEINGRLELHVDYSADQEDSGYDNVTKAESGYDNVTKAESGYDNVTKADSGYDNLQVPDVNAESGYDNLDKKEESGYDNLDHPQEGNNIYEAVNEVPYQALYEYEATSSEQLNLRPGDELVVDDEDCNGWMKGHMISDPSIKGWFPTTYVRQMIQPSDTSRISIDNTTFMSTFIDDDEFDDHLPGLAYKAVFPHHSHQDGDLSFEVGETIVVLECLENGWWRGCYGDQTGWFPGNYVEVIPQSPTLPTLQIDSEDKEAPPLAISSPREESGPHLNVSASPIPTPAKSNITKKFIIPKLVKIPKAKFASLKRKPDKGRPSPPRPPRVPKSAIQVIVNVETKRKLLARPSVPPPPPPPPPPSPPLPPHSSPHVSLPEEPEHPETDIDVIKSDIEALYDSIAEELQMIDSVEDKKVKPVMEVKPWLDNSAPVKPKSPPRPPPPSRTPGTPPKKEAPPRPNYSPTNLVTRATEAPVTESELPKLTLQDDSEVKRGSLLDLQKQISEEVANWKKSQAKSSEQPAKCELPSKPVIPPKPERLKPPYGRAKSESNLFPNESLEITEIPKLSSRSTSLGAMQSVSVDSLVAWLPETDVDDGAEIVIEEVIEPPGDFNEVEIFVDEMYEKSEAVPLPLPEAEKTPERSYGLTILTAADIGNTPKIMLQYKDSALTLSSEENNDVSIESPPHDRTPTDSKSLARFLTPSQYNSTPLNVSTSPPSLYSQAQISPLSTEMSPPSEQQVCSPDSDSSHLRFYTPAKFVRSDIGDSEVKIRSVRPNLEPRKRDSSSDEGSNLAFKFSAPKPHSAANSSEDSGSDGGMQRQGGTQSIEYGSLKARFPLHNDDHVYRRFSFDDFNEEYEGEESIV